MQVLGIVVLQVFCCLGLALLILDRISWAPELRFVTTVSVSLFTERLLPTLKRMTGTVMFDSCRTGVGRRKRLPHWLL